MTRHALWTLTGVSLLAAALGCSMGAATRATVPASTSVAVAADRPKGSYLPAHHFKLEIDGVIVGGFKTLAITLDGETAEGIEQILALEAQARKRPGPARYSHIVLKQGFVAEANLAVKPADGQPAQRKSGSVIYLDRAGAEVLRYQLSDVTLHPETIVVDEHADAALLTGLTFEAGSVQRTVFRPARGEVK
jgi:hypothetical protein